MDCMCRARPIGSVDLATISQGLPEDRTRPIDKAILKFIKIKNGTNFNRVADSGLRRCFVIVGRLLSRSKWCYAHRHSDGPPPISILIPSTCRVITHPRALEVKQLQFVARAREWVCTKQTDVPARLSSLYVMCIRITSARRLGPIRFG